jgi:23S rRNA (cytosine1962-C5)-methyltransferase
MPPRPTLVRELGLRFAVELWQPRNPGLFLDARPARAWIRGHSEGRRVLNLFAFTGSLGIAAAAGGARGVTHVDSQKRALARCRDNHDHNGLHIDDRDLVRVNVYQHLRRASAQRRQFDAIIADVPPESYASRRNDRTPGARGVAGLAASMTRMLAPGGWMLCFFHHGGERGEREAEVLRAADAPLEIAWRGGSGPDFPEADLRRSLRLTAFARAA